MKSDRIELLDGMRRQADKNREIISAAILREAVSDLKDVNLITGHVKALLRDFELTADHICDKKCRFPYEEMSQSQFDEICEGCMINELNKKLATLRREIERYDKNSSPEDNA